MPFVTVCMSILRLKTAFVIIFGPLTLFLDKTIVLWSVLLLEIMSPQAGWQLIWMMRKRIMML